MLNILCVCGNGMGTSTLLKISVKNICKKNNIDAEVESCSFGEALSYLPTTDLVLTSPEWASMIPPSDAIIVETKNLIDAEQVEKILVEAVKENFSEHIIN